MCKDVFSTNAHNLLSLTIHSPTEPNKGKWRKCAKFDYNSLSQAATLEWRAKGGHCIVMQEAPGLNPGGTPFLDPYLREEIV